MKSNNNNNSVNGFVLDLDYLIWAMSRVFRAEGNQEIPNSNPWRVAKSCRWAGSHSRFERMELPAILEFARQIGADCRLIALPPVETSELPRAMYISQALQICEYDVLQVRRRLGEWISSLSQSMTIDELTWGAELTQEDVQAVLSGSKAQVELISRVLCAAGYTLRFWFFFRGSTVGSTDFSLRFPYAAPAQFRAYRQEEHVGYAENGAFLQALLGDI